MAANGNSAPADPSPSAPPRPSVMPPSVAPGHAEPVAFNATPGSPYVRASVEPDALPPNVTALPNVAVRPQGALVPSEPARVPAERWEPSDRDDRRIVLSRTETISIPATAAMLPAALARVRAGLELRPPTPRPPAR